MWGVGSLVWGKCEVKASVKASGSEVNLGTEFSDSIAGHTQRGGRFNHEGSFSYTHLS